MPRIEEYDVVSTDQKSLLVEYVNSKIDMGWQPYGGLVRTDSMFHQPIVKYSRPLDVGPG